MNAADTQKQAKAATWQDVVEHPRFQGADSGTREKIRGAFFDQVVRPMTPEPLLEDVKQGFRARTDAQIFGNSGSSQGASESSRQPSAANKEGLSQPEGINRNNPSTPEQPAQRGVRPMGAGDVDAYGDHSGFIQEAMSGWGKVTKSDAFRQGDWQTRQRMRGDYLDSALRSRLPDDEYTKVLGEFMTATEADVMGDRSEPQSQSMNFGYGGGLADQRALQERRQNPESQVGLQVPETSSPDSTSQPAPNLIEHGNQMLDNGLRAFGLEGLLPEQQANLSASRAAEPAPAEQPDEEGSILTDFGNLLSMGADRAALNTREVVRKTLGEGVVSSIDRADEWLNGQESEALLSDRIDRNEGELTKETDKAREKAWWDSEEGKLGPAWSDWRSYFSGITESIPETAMTMAPSMMLSKGVYTWNTARGIAPKLAAKRAATTATLAGGLSEGLLGGGASSREVRESIRSMPEQQLSESAAVQSLMSEGGLTFEQARDTLAEDASSQAFVTSGVVTGAFGGLGDRALARIITGGPSSRLGAALRGAVGEGVFEEMPQEAGQQASENLAMRRADESVGVLDGVPNAALGGLAIGAGMGAGMGAVAGGSPQEASSPDNSSPETGEPGESRQYGSEAEFEQRWREHEREHDLEPIDLLQDTGTVIDIAPNADLIRTPRHELSSSDREARDSLTYGDDFKALRTAARQQGDTQSVAELDALSEEVSDLLEAESISRTRGEPLEPVRERLNVAGDRFAQVVDRIRTPASTATTGLDLPDSDVRQSVEQAAANTDIEPTAAQAEAGNYRKGRVRLNGFDIAIENPKGSTRRGTAPDGIEWESQMAHHYGDIKGTTAADGDNLDVFIGDNPTSPSGYIIDQVTADGSFDEHKVMLGFDSLEEASQGYLANYEADWQGLGSINEMPVDDLKTWIREGATDKPYGEIQARTEPKESSEGRSTAAVSEITPGAQVAHNDQSRTVADVITHPTSGRRLVSFRDAPNNYVFEDDVSAANAAAESQKESETVAEASPEPKTRPAPTLKSDGKPFQTRRAVELSKRFRDTPNATPIEVDGGWGFVDQDADVAESFSETVDAENQQGSEGSTDGQVKISPASPRDFDLHGWRQPRGGEGQVFRIERNGESVGFADMAFYPDGEARIMDIVSDSGAGSIGTTDMRGLLRELRRTRPDIKRITGERVSGARRGGQHGFAGSGQEVAIDLPQDDTESRQLEADREADDFALSGSNRPNDVAESRGQNDIFESQPASPAAEPAPRSRKPRDPEALTPRQQRASDAFGGAMPGDSITLTQDVGYARAGSAYKVNSIARDGSLSVTSEERGSSTVISQGEWIGPYRRANAALAEANRDADDSLSAGSDSTSDQGARGQSPLFAFAGERSETADTPRLNDAQQRLDTGESAETVRRETGWFKGPDERWRFEINDSDARFLPVANGTAGELWAESLDRVLDFPALFAAYPDLRSLDVVSARGMGSKRGEFSARRGEIVLNAERSPLDQFSTLLHEIQHGIQRLEGFATGGDPSDYRLPPLKEKWLEGRVHALGRQSGENAAQLMERHRAGELALEEVQQGIRRYADEIGLNELRRQLNAGNERGAYRYYQRLAGEVEARNVQARQGMSDADRIITSPLETADMPPNEAVVVYNGRALEQAPPPANADPALPPNGAPYVRDLAQRLAEHPALSGVRAIQTAKELPSHVLDTMEARGIDAGQVAGAYDPTSGESFVVADNLMGVEEGVRRAVHEAVGHQGIHGVLGADVAKVMTQVYQSYRRSASGNEALREIRRAYPYLNADTEAGRIGIAEELVARSIEQSDGRPALRERVMASVRNALRTLFPGVAWTDADIRALGERARRYMQNRQNRQWRNPEDPAAALGLSSVVRADGGETGVPVGEAQRVVDAFMTRYQGNIPLRVRVAATQEELYGPQASIANVGRLKGGYHPARGVMTVVAGNANGVRDIQRTLRHEILGHYGINTFPAREKRVLLDRILETQDSPALASAWESVRRNYADAPLDVQAEEVFAYAAEVERGTLGKAWDRVLSGLQRALRVAGLSRSPLRMAELHDLVRRIGEGIREGRRSQQIFPATDQEQFSRETPVDEPSIRFSLKDKQPDSAGGPYGPNDSTGFALPDESYLDHKLRVWADKMRPLKRLRRAIQQAGGNIEEEADPYLTEELYHGRLENDLESFRHNYVEPLAEGLAKAKMSQAGLDDYMYALHAPERNAVVAERNPNDPTLQDGGSGMTNADAAEIIDKVARSGKQAEYDRLAKIVHDITAVRRDAIRDGGLETDDVMDAWEDTYQHYVPLKGFANDEPEAPRIGKGFQITGKESFMVKGRRERAASPSTQAIVDANLAMIRRRKNEVGNAFLSMVTDHPNPALWDVFTDDNPDTERATVRVTDPETGEKRWEVRERSVQMARDDRYFKTKRAGRTYYIKVKDQRLLNAMRNVGPESNFWITRVAGAATRIMSSLMTSLSPEFLVTNFERDIQTALLNVGAEQTRDDGKIKGQRILWDTARDVRPAMRAVWRGLNRSKANQKPEVREWDRWFKEFIEDGTKTGYFDMKDIDAQAKEIAAMVRRANGTTLSHMLKARKKTADFVENVNGAVENAVRLSAYANARRNGLSRKQAASLAKNLTVNFNRRGEIGTGLNAAYMFANASIQGSMNFARVMVTLKNTPKGKSPLNVWSRFNLGQKIGFGMASAAFSLALLNRWLSDEDDDGVLFYDKVPDHVKERHYVLMTGWATGNPEDYIKIPLPYGYNTFAVAGTHLEAVMAGVESPAEAGKNLGLAVAGSFSPIGFEDSESLGGVLAKNLTPTLARSLVQLGWNEDFAARLIYRENDPYGIPSPESSLYMRSTPEAYKTISSVMNDITDGSQHISGDVDINPDVIQHLVNYYGGGAWSFVEKTADFAARSVTGQEVENYRTPFVGKVLGTVTPYQDQSQFYQRRDELGQIFKEAESLEGREGVEYRKDNRERIRLYLDAVDITNNLRDLRQERDIIEDSDTLDDETKRKRIENVEERMKFQVDRFNRQYNALE